MADRRDRWSEMLMNLKVRRDLIAAAAAARPIVSAREQVIMQNYGLISDAIINRSFVKRSDGA